MENQPIKYFSKLYDSIHFPINVLDEAGRIVYVNQAFIYQWGYKLSELSEYTIFEDFELKRCGIVQIIQKVFDKKNYAFINHYSDSLLKSKEITIPVLRTKVFPVILDGSLYVVLFHIDITDMVLAEKEIVKAKDATSEAERLKNTFLNVLSHEMRTPLNIILGYSSIIRDSMSEKLDSEDRVYFDNLYSGSKRLFNSITQMLEFAQIEAGAYTMNIERADLIDIIKRCVAVIQKSAFEKNLDIKLNFNQQPVFVDVDVQCVENTINNLVSNAVKFTRQGFIEIEAGVLDERDLAYCKIKDSGIGISSDYLDHLFSPFSQEDLGIGRDFEGNGLGLALAKRYLEKFGGSLLVDSLKGVGSTFTFTLPLSQDNLSSGARSAVTRIFILDDFSESSSLIKAFLQDSYLVESKSLRDFNIDDLSRNDFKIILIDVNQIHFEQSLIIVNDIYKNDVYKRPIIVSSAELSDEKIKRFSAAGAKKFLLKPFSKIDLLNALDSFLK
ncbi:MAG: PAS domain S-box protein [Ignavibacteriaceae bacterium]|nr:PAS domain S-box protein [Ignavibacteriaceae bacterium]